MVRDKTGLSLKVAKDIVDAIEMDNRDLFMRMGADRNLSPYANRPQPSHPYDEFTFLEKAFEALIIAHRGTAAPREIAENAMALSRQMAERANLAYEEKMKRRGY